MSVQNTQVEIAKNEIARAKLISGLISLAILAGSCAPMQTQSAKAEPLLVAVASSQAAFDNTKR